MSAPLISNENLQERGMLQIREDGSFGKPNSMRIQDSSSITRYKDTSEDSAITSSEEMSENSTSALVTIRSRTSETEIARGRIRERSRNNEENSRATSMRGNSAKNIQSQAAYSKV